MQTAPVRSNSLTAHLARAAGGDVRRPTVADAQEPDETPGPPVIADGRCTVSVAPGQHCGRAAKRGNDLYLSRCEIGGHFGQAIVAAICPAVFDGDIFPLDIAGFVQPAVERG